MGMPRLADLVNRENYYNVYLNFVYSRTASLHVALGGHYCFDKKECGCKK